MSSQFNRRDFIAYSMAASAGSSLAAQAGAAPVQEEDAPPKPAIAAGSKNTLPTGKIGKLTLSRLISGGNLISGWAHSRDLHYVPALMRAYNTEEKVMDTLQLLEEHGVNTIIADPAKKCMDIFGRYWKQRGGKIQWIAEGHPDLDDWKTNIKRSIDFGASAIYIQGVICDNWYNANHLDLAARCVEFIKSHGVPGGIGAHKLDVVMESEKKNYGADFYVKTLHHTMYWSTRRQDQNSDVVSNPCDNYFDLDPEKTIAFMQGVKKPWIAFKVLAAGAIQPKSGFSYALRNGADFICVGMFDFQVEQNVALVKEILPKTQSRNRGWMA
ncbi:MAG: hypothetical protein ABSG68_18070 [Thermoguttaceae bacterium]|jgi:hypothetical protein